MDHHLMLDFSQFSVVTFDCYGTLIDWESGILGVLRPMLHRRGARADDDAILAAYSEAESAAERPPYKSYRKVLEDVTRSLGAHFGFKPTAEDVGVLGESLPHWKPFSDTRAALERLKKRYRLGVISNIDDDMFAATAQTLHVPFDFLVTAQSARSYKPDPNNFRIALERIGLPKERVLHVAESLYHDIAPANQLGLTSVWVRRRFAGRLAKASKSAQATADLIVDDLAALADLASG